MDNNVKEASQSHEPWKKSIYLPTDVKPISYELSMRPLLDYGRFYASEKITIEVINKTAYFVIHAKDLHITSCNVTSAGENCLNFPVKKSFFYEPHEFFVILLEQAVNPGVYHLDFNFDGTLKNPKEGLFRSYYFCERSKSLRPMAGTKFKLTNARRAYPCFDEPHLKATFKVKIVRPVQNYVVITNEIIEKEEFGPEKNEVTVFFEETKPISTFATGFIVAELFECQALDVDNMNKKIIIKTHAIAEKGDKLMFSRELITELMTFFIKYFDMPFPVSKLDLVALPEIPEPTVEQCGYIIFHENFILFDKAVDSVEVMKNIALTIAREICRQWFGYMVTMKSWSDLWFSEGFISFMKYHALNEGVSCCADWSLAEQLILDVIQPVMAADVTVGRRPLCTDHHSPEEVKKPEYIDFASKKGLALLRMLESLIGAEGFRRGIHRFLSTYAYSNFNISDFWDCLNNEVNDPDVNVTSFMEGWTKQSGYPVIYVIKRANTWILSQSRFVVDRNAFLSSTDSSFRYKWDVPLYYVASNDKNPVLVWFRSSEECLKLMIKDRTVSYLKFNYGQTGFYRVNYEGCLWTLFAQSLVQNHTTFNCIDRAGLIDDVFHLAEAGQTDYEYAFQLLSYMEKEKDFLPWITVSKNLKNLLNRFPNTPLYGLLIRYIRNIIKKIYSYEKSGLSWNTFHSDSFATRLFRRETLELACISKLPECMEDLCSKFKDWIATGASPVSPDLFHLLICKGMLEFGNIADWETVLNRYKKEKKGGLKQSLLACLAHTREQHALMSLLLPPGSEILESDYLAYLRYISQNLYCKHVCWNFIRNDFAYLSERVSSNKRELHDFIIEFASKYCKQYQLEEVELFFDKHPEVGGENSAREIIVSSITRNMAFVKRNTDPISDWLTENGE